MPSEKRRREMHVTKEGIEYIKSANELAAVVAERGIALKRKGKVLVALCPFHQEKTPSFTITPAKGLYHCFGCGAAGDVIGFVTRHEKLTFSAALELLAKRAGLSLSQVMAERPRSSKRASPPLSEKSNGNGNRTVNASELLGRVVEHYNRTFCEREDAQAYLRKRGLTDPELLRSFKVGYADGSLLRLVAKEGGARDELLALGVITAEGRELLGGCIVVPIPDPLTGQWTNLYGRGMKTDRHCYLPGALRGVLNYQAARLSSEVILTESILDALSFHQAGITTAIPIYGTNGFTGEHLDLLKRESVKEVVLALDNDEPGRKATEAIKDRLALAGVAVRLLSFPARIKDANELLVSRDGDAGDVFRKLLAEARASAPAAQAPPARSPDLTDKVLRQDGQLVLRADYLTYQVRPYPAVLGRLRATVKVERADRFHVDTIDLYSSRSRTEFSRRVGKLLAYEASFVEEHLLSLLAEAEKPQETPEASASPRPSMSDAERAEALAFLKRPDLLDQVARDIDALGFVGEDINKRLLYLVANSRKLPDPLSAVILSQSGAGKSGLTEVIEQVTPPEDVVLLTRLTPQSLYYVAPGFLDQKLVIVEERYGSAEADYSIRVLQSRKKLIAAAPIKDPQTGNLRTKVFIVEARAAFIEATTASSVNHENATRCFELTMDESVDQTRRIHERQRLLRTPAGLRLRQQTEAIVRRHWNAQRLLEPLPVVIPYADQLTFPSTWMRTRRDHARFLNLIEVSAFLHQHQRDRQDGAIVASVADYAAAYELAAQVLADTLTDLKKPLREAYQRIRELSLKGEGSVSRRDIREALSLPDSTIRGWLSELVELEYLEAEVSKGGAGKATRYRLTDRGPRAELVLGLLTPEELQQKLGGHR
jgi:DNA primase catalytic core